MKHYLDMFTFVESPLFTRLVHHYLSDEEYTELQKFLIMHPRVGKVISGSGGIRKLRWKSKSTGKRGGLRLIYYLRTSAGKILLLTLYSKTSKSNIPPHILKAIKKEMDDD